MEDSLTECEKRMQQYIDEQQQSHTDAIAKLIKKWDYERYQMHAQ